MSLPASCGLFGKFPGHAEFVRLHAGTNIERAFERWLEDNALTLAKHGLVADPHPVHFVFRDRTGTDALVGTLCASHDAVGRAFPLSVFARVELALAHAHYPVFPDAFADFFATSASLLHESASLDLSGLGGLLQLVPQPPADAVHDVSVRAHRALDDAAAELLLTRMFGPVDDEHALHGFGLFVAACARARGRDPGTAAMALDCPVTSDLELLFWLELSRRALAWPATVPSFFWRTQGEARLLLCLGEPGSGVLQTLANVEHHDVWPLRKPTRAGIDAGKQILTADQVFALRSTGHSAAALIARLASS